MSLRRLSFLLLGACTLNDPAALKQPIINGTFDPEHPAVVALTNGQFAFCSGTLISRRVVLTAAHCVDPQITGVLPEDVEIFFGPDVNRRDGLFYPTAGMAGHPGFDTNILENDIGVVILARDAPVAPMPFLDRPFDESFMGQEALFVGYGVAENLVNAGLKRKIVLPIVDFNDTQFFYQGEEGGTCFGDSGGPAFLSFDAGETVIGVTSFGDSNCELFSADTRVDAFLPTFVRPFLEAEPPLDVACSLDGACNASCDPPDPDCDLINCDAGNTCNRACPLLDEDCPDRSCDQDGICDDRCQNPSQDLDCICLNDGVCTEVCGELDPDCQSGCQIGPPSSSSFPKTLVLLLLAFLFVWRLWQTDRNSR